MKLLVVGATTVVAFSAWLVIFNYNASHRAPGYTAVQSDPRTHLAHDNRGYLCEYDQNNQRIPNTGCWAQ